MFEERYSHMRFGGLRAYGQFDERMSKPIGSVTSRDQFIDPYSLVNINNYKRTAGGKALYNADLKRAQAYLEQQEAAYQEWYESPAQVALRERQAGRNPDLIDGALGPGEASDTQPSDTSAMEGIPTIGEQVSSGIQTTMSVVSTIGNLISLPSQIMNLGAASKLTGAQANLANMQGLKEFEGLVYNDISDKFATALSAAADAGQIGFTIADFMKSFSSEQSEELFGAYAPEDTPKYRAAYKRALGNFQKIQGSAFETGANTVSNKTSFAKLLSHPYHDKDLTLMVAMMEPVEVIRQRLDEWIMNVKGDYIAALDGGMLAEEYMDSQRFQNKIAEANGFIASVDAAIKSNLLEFYKANPASLSGMNALSLLLGHGPMSWQDQLANYLQVLLEQFKKEHGLTPGEPSDPSESPTSNTAIGGYRGTNGSVDPVTNFIIGGHGSFGDAW